MARDTYTFEGVSFTAVADKDEDTPFWQPFIEATDRRLIGTDRFERSIRTTMWVYALVAWIEPSAGAGAMFQALQRAYMLGTLGTLLAPSDTDDPDASYTNVLIMNFQMAPVHSGIDGYRGKLVFARPGGAP